jgi:galactose-1-phosphate uridylyltransferase
MAVEPGGSIAELDTRVAALPMEDRRRFEQIFDLGAATGELVPPEEMRPWLVAQFGSLEAVCRQRIVKITNRVTMEGTLFNALRARRPLQAPPLDDDLRHRLEDRHDCDFCHPETRTPADTFGRIRGKHCITASNVAKIDGWHGVIVFDEHHPLRFTASRVSDYVDTAQEWARAAHRADPAACYPFFLWNCLWRSGASIVHGHAQIAVTRARHYVRVESWRRAALQYIQAHGSDYFSDLVAVHRALGLSVAHGSAIILPSLTPAKEKETLILAQEFDSDLKSALYRVLRTLIDQLQVQSFNLVLYQRPLCSTVEDWSGFPHIIRIVDRGSVQSITSDVGAMEFFAQSIVTADPYHLTAALLSANQEEIP